MDDSSSKPFFIALLAGGALLLAGIAIGVVGTTAAVKSEWLVLGRSSAESQSISAPKLEYEENQGWIRSSALTAVRTKCASALRNSCTGWRSFHVLKALGNTSSNPSPAQLFISREPER